MKKIILISVILLSITTIVSSLTSCNKPGCADPEATNYDPKAKKNDGSCVYEGSIVVQITKCNFLYNDGTYNHYEVKIDGTVEAPVGSRLTISGGYGTKILDCGDWANVSNSQSSYNEISCEGQTGNPVTISWTYKDSDFTVYSTPITKSYTLKLYAPIGCYDSCVIDEKTASVTCQ